MNREQYPQQNTARMEKILGSSSQNGLTLREAENRLKKYGKNTLGDERDRPFKAFFKTVFKNGSLPIAVLGFGISSFLLGRVVLLPSLLYLFFLVLYFCFFCRREKEFCAQRERLMPRVRVVRDGKMQSISPEMLVFGDLFLLSPGDVLYAHAHITTDAQMTVYGHRGNVGQLFIKHGGDCFDGSDEPFNTLLPGDIIKEGSGAAFVTEKAKNVALPASSSKTFENHGKTCRIATRISCFLVLIFLGVSALRAVLSGDYAFLGESLSIGTVLLSTSGSSFYSLLFDLLYLYKNGKTAEKNGALFASVSDTESLSVIDSFVLSTRSMFRSARYVAKFFETASGKRIKEKTKGTSELSFLADVLFSVKSKCGLSMEEEAVLGFSEKYATGRRPILYAKSTSEKCTLTSYRNPADGRNFSLVWGDAELLISNVLYLSEDGKTRVLDAKQRDIMLEGIRRFKRNGYRFLLFAETQTRNTKEGMPQSFSDMKLLGFFALRKITDEQATKSLSLLKKENKKVFFVHYGENADWLAGEIALFDGVPILDGAKESFREELSYFIKDDTLSFCIGIHLSSQQKALVASMLETAGRRVLAFGDSFDDHRMMCAATAAIAPFGQEDKQHIPSLVAEAASLRAEEHVSSQVDSVKRAPHLLGVIGVFTAALCASLLGRCAVALFGAVFGKIFLGAEYYALLGVVFDLLALYCFMISNGKTQYEGESGLLRENRKNFSFFAGFLVSALVVGALAAYLAFDSGSVSFVPGSFVFVSLLLMLNVGIWRFSMGKETTARFLYPLASFLTVTFVFLLGHFTNGRLGFLFRPDVLFWALFPIVVLMAVGKLFEAYFEQKNTFHIGENNERM
ncbi:MAG: hypothetical protein E7609_00700 [Ruminococcaceae bacterium]|nr:hypothetical protein [Oscillospiraceae bacterium]